MERRKRACYLDLLRIIACFLVILNHTPGYIASFEVDSSKTVLLLIFHLLVEMVVKIGVPIFYMISGALLLKKDISYKSLLKRVLKMFFILLIFSIIANIVATGHFYYPGFIRNFASATVEGAGPYWYIYTYIGILLIIPFMRSIALRLTKTDVYYLLVIRFLVTGVIAIIILALNILNSSNMYVSEHFQPVFITVDCIFYTLMGFGLDSLWDIKAFSKRKGIYLILLFVGTALVEAWLTWLSGVEKVFTGLDFIMTISIFMGIKAILNKRKPSERMKKVITSVGSLTFGIYLLDPIIGVYLKPLVHELYPHIPFYLGVSILYSVISMVVCGLITYLYKRCTRGLIK
ncbi:MAG: acyltransferase [Butyrivibrio sp.]|nr:acyltransferase [Butyrivibrio sp.]